MRTSLRTALLLSAALTLAACGGMDEDDTANDMGADAAAPAGTAVALADGDEGAHLVDGDGMALYLFTADAPGTSTCSGGCLDAWPALTTDGAPTAGDGVDATLLGTLTRADGTTQVTYADLPLYRYASDMAPGDTAGQGVNGVWFLVAADGTAIGADAGATDDAADGMDGEDSDGGSDAGGYSY